MASLQLPGEREVLSSSSCVLGLHGEVLVVEGLQGWVCEKLPEAFPMPKRVNGSQVQDGIAPGQAQAH